MLDTSTRLLGLLSLLQARRDWSGAELAERLEVGPRTIRRDVDRLRRLGYPVHAAPGVAGGYRLGPGASLPPLLLDEEEAVAVAGGLRAPARGGGPGARGGFGPPPGQPRTEVPPQPPPPPPPPPPRPAAP